MIMNEQLSLFSDDIGKLSLTEEQKRILGELYKKGYRYVTYSATIPSIPLNFWSLKPRIYKEKEGLFWGYEEKHWNHYRALMSAPISNFDILELHSVCDKSPLSLESLID
jgi:hypothetical protein